MSTLGASTNRWGDPPIVAHRSTSSTATWAFILSATAALTTLVCNLVPPGILEGSIFGPIVLLLAFLFRLAAMPLGMGLSYAALLTIRRDGAISGRGLAWAGLGFSYLSLLWFTSVISFALPNGVFYFYGVSAVACLHGLAIASECTAAKAVIVAAFVATPLLSLMALGIRDAREESRRLQCLMHLRDLALVRREKLDIGTSPSERAWALPNPLPIDEFKAKPERVVSSE